MYRRIVKKQVIQSFRHISNGNYQPVLASCQTQRAPLFPRPACLWWPAGEPRRVSIMA